MAIVSTILCMVCKEKKQVTHSACDSPPLVCHDCAREEAERKEMEYLEACAQLDPEERFQKIEKWIYKHSKTLHYKPPSTFG